MEQLKTDLKAVKPDEALDVGVAARYFSTDMFIAALKQAAEDGKDNITPEAVREAASTMTWKIDGLGGPTRYPEATVKAMPSCNTLAFDDGTAWKTTYPFGCSEKAWPVKG